MDTQLGVLLGTALASSLYAWFLQRPKVSEWYVPDWIWLTVAGGNTLIGLMFALWLHLDHLEVSDGPLAAFWRLLALNIAAGVPIIAWQLGQAAGRPSNRRSGARHASEGQKRPAGD